ncbi:MAG: glutamine--fructose-6-phosphate transaminase (isomerizing) [Proteobacteria bacterium]|nr:glutamine--fructose-6-phosphate transaminase (isomerizing) [Pseudomonadota bacterium]
MCGIIGLVSDQKVSLRLLEGLKRLEYRGYDSAGLATIHQGLIERRRTTGKLQFLEELVMNQPLEGHVGIGHTRWATHGLATQDNAHPHANEEVAVVHNGIIENYIELKDYLLKKGYTFHSQTDTEVVLNLVTHYFKQHLSPLESMKETLKHLQGAFALAFIFKRFEDRLIVARQGSPLVIGFGEGEMSVGSDGLVLAPWTQKLCYLEEGDYAEVTRHGALIFNRQGDSIERPLKQTYLTSYSIGKGKYRHYMLKEIHEQPIAIGNTLHSLINQATEEILEKIIPLDWSCLSRLYMVACGTSYYAAMVAKYWFEKYAGLPCEVDIASEFRYRHPLLCPNGAVLFISQSGETIDTLAALECAKLKKCKTIAIVNVPESSIARAADHVLYTLAGPEIGVASTKAFTTQLTVLACLVLEAAKIRKQISLEQMHQLVQALVHLPTLIVETLEKESLIQELAQTFIHCHDVLYLGRGTSYPIALEGALKLKEISYIHAEGYPAGELKHGPIALIDSQVPVVVLAPRDEWFLKTVSNIQEVLAREAKTFVFTDQEGSIMLESLHANLRIIKLPQAHPFITPILYSILIQLLAYYTAWLKGTDVDQPRNLAKSVTVE